jgi:hypothetical protein
MKDHKKPRNWTNSLDKRPKRKELDIRLVLGMSEVRIREAHLGQWR